MKSYRPARLLLLGLLLALPKATFAQDITPIAEGEYTYQKVTTEKPSNLTLHGFYEGSYNAYKHDSLGKKMGPAIMKQEVELKIETNAHNNVSLHATLSNQKRELANQRAGYSSEREENWGDSRNPDGLDLYLKEMYLEYNHNPSAVLKLGRQYASVGARLGLIYSGWATGATQTCGIGTWCYYIGGLKLDHGESNSLYWGQLTYPVYKSGTEIVDPWAKDFKRDGGALDIELFRILYQGWDIPVGANGVWADPGSGMQLTEGGEPVFIDNKKADYIGFNLDWKKGENQLLLNLISLQGHRIYHTGTNATGDRVELADIAATGTLINAEYHHRLGPHWKALFGYLNSPGTEQASPTQKLWEQDSTSYFEIQQGYFGKAMIYLDGVQHTGQGHSVSNLTMQRLSFLYKKPVKGTFSMDIDYYEFLRSSAVFNEAGEPVTKIGRELDLIFHFHLAETLTADLGFAMFSVDEAYSPDDHTAPALEPNDLSLASLQIRYDF